MKFCKDCKHYRGSYMHMEVDKCVAPQNGYSLVDGNIIIKFASVCRAKPYQDGTISRCGPDALYFEEKPVSAKKPWYKFWNKF